MPGRLGIFAAHHGVMPWDVVLNHGGSSRGWRVLALDDSLRRLGVDHVDLYQIHRRDPTASWIMVRPASSARAASCSTASILALLAGTVRSYRSGMKVDRLVVISR
ncbi:aldo/keto reductase, partial [Nocardia cyriacigeorgica]|uniref:aldo/keto reductase n=1 Tax=Nocardia cyriacigeorgica TaxID=135487 RepID=UPI003CC7CB5C